MKMVVGLGNPGRKYRGTRHNVGFEVLSELHRRVGSPRASAKFESEVVEAMVGGEKTLCLCPLTFMNLSGRAVRAAVDFYKLSLDDLLVVCDDFNLELGRLRFRKDGSSGGQNGLQDILRTLNGEAFARLRIGVGRLPDNWEASDFVLSRFREREKPEIEMAIRRAADGVETWVGEGIEASMNRFNTKPEKERPDVSDKPLSSAKPHLDDKPKD